MQIEDSDIIDNEIEEYFQIGQKLSIIRLFTDEEDDENYPSYVKDIDDNAIFIDLPTKLGIRVPVHVEDILEITVLTNACAFSGKVVVLDIQTGDIDGLWASMPEMLEKIQRRDFKRWEMKFPLKICVMSENRVVEEINGESFDISGTGISISSKYTVPHNKDYRIKFQYKDINADLKANFIHLHYDTVKKNYVLGFEFIDIDRHITDKIHKLGILFELDLRRKGLI
ncbi:MAG: PilZ domain-containing protein [Candidatus Gastranaerophilales bacterium]|nr:PilZ domain-containing protein [Candidatus Gastranaerophilales bacterium]